MSIGYIYLITNLINNKKYVGQTRNTIEERWRKHCSKAKNNSPTGIDGAIKKYGKNNFSCKLILKCDIADLDEWEKYFIKKFNTYGDKGYNLTLGGEGSTIYDINEKEMLFLYENGKTARELSRYYNCSENTIGNRLKKYNINTKEHQKEWLKKHPEYWKENLKKGCGKPFQKGEGVKSVYCIELDKSFVSLKECSQWLLDNNYTTAKNMDTVRKSLSRHLNGDRASYLKMHFKFI